MSKYIKIFFYLSLLYSCIPKNVTNEINPIECSEIKDDKKIIKETLLLQVPGSVPMKVEVNDEYFTWSYRISKPNVVYYKYIEDLKIIHDNSGRYEIRFNNSSNGESIIIKTKEKKIAVKGYSAILCMIKRNID